jgi:hypothetical protein
MPPFWRVMCREALGLGEHLAWSFWRALSKSQ